jgi:homoaconitase/3-isopropylmalate dehydratase large subunit
MVLESWRTARSASPTSTESFAGRMGSERASVFLASPLTVAASAVAGRIVGAVTTTDERLEGQRA